MLKIDEQLSQDNRKVYLSTIQRGIINALSRSAHPLTLAEIIQSLSKRPCARKLIPQLVQLEKQGVVTRIDENDNCMENRYVLCPDWIHSGE